MLIEVAACCRARATRISELSNKFSRIERLIARRQPAHAGYGVTWDDGNGTLLVLSRRRTTNCQLGIAVRCIHLCAVSV